MFPIAIDSHRTACRVSVPSLGVLLLHLGEHPSAGGLLSFLAHSHATRSGSEPGTCSNRSSSIGSLSDTAPRLYVAPREAKLTKQ